MNALEQEIIEKFHQLDADAQQRVRARIAAARQPDPGDPPRTEAEVRHRLYLRARGYWTQHGPSDRLALTDAELDEQFAFIDADGVPHLHTDNIPTPATALDDLLGILDTDATDLSTSVRSTLRQHFGPSDEPSIQPRF